MKMYPEHVIVSNEYDRDGNGDITLRLYPLKKGGVFRFYRVKGGQKAHPDLTGADFWEIEGTVYKAQEFHKHRSWITVFIDITSKRKLSREECKKTRVVNNQYWEKYYEEANIEEKEYEKENEKNA